MATDKTVRKYTMNSIEAKNLILSKRVGASLFNKCLYSSNRITVTSTWTLFNKRLYEISRQHETKQLKNNLELFIRGGIFK